MFKPQEHLTIIDGAAYLEVKWRLVWLREAHPDAIIETDMIESSRDHAIFKASVRLSDGASATGWGSEFREVFPNFVEAAETKAIGRALAALGFGTQFANELQTDSGGSGLSDAPVPINPATEQKSKPTGPTLAEPSDRQKNLIDVLGRELSLSVEELETLAREHGGSRVTRLDRRGASALITEMKRMKQEQSDRKKRAG